MDKITVKNQLIIQQVKEWAEIIIDWETANRYKILDVQKNELGFIAEKHNGLITTLGRQFLRSHRPLTIDVFNSTKQAILQLSRPFFFFWSDLSIKTKQGQLIGSVHRRFAFIYKKYDLRDERDFKFATIKSPFWRIWKFPLLDKMGFEQGSISKKWGGILKEVFTDADCYLIDYGKGQWTKNQKTVILAAAISIDFDFFEENQKRNN